VSVLSKAPVTVAQQLIDGLPTARQFAALVSAPPVCVHDAFDIRFGGGAYGILPTRCREVACGRSRGGADAVTTRVWRHEVLAPRLLDLTGILVEVEKMLAA
jgi:hypothetical protein